MAAIFALTLDTVPHLANRFRTLQPAGRKATVVKTQQQ